MQTEFYNGDLYFRADLKKTVIKYLIISRWYFMCSY